MKNLTKSIFAMLLTAALLMTASVSVFATDTDTAAAETQIQPLALEIEGMTNVPITSSDSNLGIDLSTLYDKFAETGYKIGFDAEEEKIFSIYTATKVPEAISAFAMVLDGESGTVITVAIYGTNDSLLTEWTPLQIGEEVVEMGGYIVFTVEGEAVILAEGEEETPVDAAEAEAAEPTKFAFYRIDLVVENGNGFEIAELSLFKTTTDDDTEYEYAYAESVEEGETLPVVPVVEEEIIDEEEIVEESTTTVTPFGFFTVGPTPHASQFTWPGKSKLPNYRPC